MHQTESGQHAFVLAGPPRLSVSKCLTFMVNIKTTCSCKYEINPKALLAKDYRISGSRNSNGQIVQLRSHQINARQRRPCLGNPEQELGNVQDVCLFKCRSGEPSSTLWLNGPLCIVGQNLKEGATFTLSKLSVFSFCDGPQTAWTTAARNVWFDLFKPSSIADQHQ